MNLTCDTHVVIFGVGAIGSHLVPLAARDPGVARLTLVDPQVFRRPNLAVQNISGCDVDQPKVGALARRARSIRPRIEVTAIQAAANDVAMGLLRGDLMVACLDSRASRQAVNEIAFRLGAPWIDLGVLASAGLARANIYIPGEGLPCLECSFDDRDYEAIQAEYPCGAGLASEQPSDTSAALACLAASVGWLECQKILGGESHIAAEGRQVVVDARSHRLLSTSFRRRNECRFDHATWQFERVSWPLRQTSVAQALAVTGSIGVPGHRFLRCPACPKCGFALPGLRLDRPQARCPVDGARMTAPDFSGLLDRLDHQLPPELQGLSLAQIGLRAGDVIRGAEKTFEILQSPLEEA